MDKSKNRKDLLAAGRKKLQQFRQKKDNKGNDSNSSATATKSGRDTAGGNATEVTPHSADGEVTTNSDKDVITVLESCSEMEPQLVDSASSTEEVMPANVGILETASSGQAAELSSRPSQLDLARLGGTVDEESTSGAMALPEGAYSSLVFKDDERGSLSDNSDVTNLKEESAEPNMPLVIDHSSELKDHSAEQEVGNSNKTENNKLMETKHEADNSFSLKDYTVRDSGTAFLENIPEADSIQVYLEARKTDDSSLSIGGTQDIQVDAQERHGMPNCDNVTDSVLVSHLNSEQTCHNTEDILCGSSAGSKVEVLDGSMDRGVMQIEGNLMSSDHPSAERSSDFGTDGTSRSLASKQLDLSSVLDGNMIRLSQLSAILQALREDEVSFLLMSRGLSLGNFIEADKMEARDVFKRLQEELYVTSFSKDVFYLHLSESEKLIDETFAAKASIMKVQEINEILAADIARCKQELQQVQLDRQELQKELLNSKDEVKVLAVEANELHNKLEIAHGEISALSSNLVDCRRLVDDLQDENEELGRNLKVMTEEKISLSEENGIILLEKLKVAGELEASRASLQSLNELIAEERRHFEEKNNFIALENSKLLAGLEDLKVAVNALEDENKKLNEMLTSTSEEGKKLKEEKVLADSQIETLLKEMTDHKDLVFSLQTKISNFNEDVESIMEEKNKLVEEKEGIYSKYEKQSHELAAVRTSEMSFQENYNKAMNDLKEAIFRINQLTEENEALNVDLEMHKSKSNQFNPSKFSSQCEEAVAGQLDNFTMPNSRFNRPSEEKSEFEVYDDSFGFIPLVSKLQRAEIMVQKLGRDIEGILSEKFVAPGVSKLIQAFESKNHVDDQDPEKPYVSDIHKSEDSHTRSKMMIEDLEVLLKELLCDAEDIHGFCQLKQTTQHDAAIAGNLSVYDSLRHHTDLLEKENVEYMVLYEALLEHMWFTAQKEQEFLMSFHSLQKDELDLRSDNDQLIEKLGYYHSKISELQKNLDTLCRASDEMVTSVSSQLESLQGEVAERELKHEEEWSSFSSKVLPNIDVLDTTVKRFYASVWMSEDRDLDFIGHVVSSIICANSAIEELYGQLEAVHLNNQEMSDKYIWVVSRLYSLRNELSELWHRTQGYYPDEAQNVLVHGKQLDLSSFDDPMSLLDQLRELFRESLNLKSDYKQVVTELRSRVSELEEVEKKCIKSDTIVKLIEEILQLSELQVAENVVDEPASLLESLIYSLVQRCREAEQGLSLSLSREMQLNALQGQVSHLNDVVMLHEFENLVFKQFLRCAQDSFIPFNSELKEKVAELEQSEHRVSSLREKLSIAVTKGKGLISQRDSLKQSLAENCKELDKCSQELQSKDARIHDLETKLKDFSEAGERMEALESELSYIRNSATALRESFLLKDSVLQRIEEILEDLELPEHFHSRDIIEKVDWLSKSVGGNALTLGDWDQRSLVGEAPYSDSGFVGVDLKDDIQPNIESIDDLRRKFEELQSKFYGLAEQNEMLEQSLMERNNLVQIWEEILDRAEMPSQLRSMEPEDKLHWLERSLADARSSCYSLKQKVDDLESLCRSLTADAEDSQRKTSELESAFRKACNEKEIMARDLEILHNDNDEHLKKMVDHHAKIANLESEVNMLQEQKRQMEGDMHQSGDAIRKLQELNADFNVRNEDIENELIILQKQKLLIEENVRQTEDKVRGLHQLVCDTLQDSYAEDILGQEAVKCLEEILMKLIKNYIELCTVKTVAVDPADFDGEKPTELSRNAVASSKEQDVATLSKDLEDSLDELTRLKEENQSYLLNCQSLQHKLGELEIKTQELVEQHNEEQQKSASLREKLNVAVRKGKSLVQQRDSMKQNIEQLNAEVEQLKSENEQLKKAISEHEEHVQKLYGIQESIQAMEYENSFFKDRLAETEHVLEEKEARLNFIVKYLDDIGGGLAFSTENPFEKLKQIANYLIDLRNDLHSSEQESSKSKRAAELVLAELNEVQERNDTLQEELAKAHHELSILSGEKDLAEKAKYEALSHIEKLSYLHSEEKDKQLSEIITLKSGIASMGEDFSAITKELCDVLSRDLLVLQNMKSTMTSFLKPQSNPDMNLILPPGSISGTLSWKSENEVFTRELASFRKQLYNHSHLLQEETSDLSELVMSVHREYTAQKDMSESIKADLDKFKLIAKEKESELPSLRGNFVLLYETCATAISEIESCKDRVVGKDLSSKDSERKPELQKPLLGSRNFFIDEEDIRDMHDRLLLGVRDLIGMQNEHLEFGQQEMKNTILNLQKELQEKDIQRDRICTEFINQIKEAETHAKNYLHELQQVREQVHDSQRQVKAMGDEQKVLKQRIKELEDHELNGRDFQERLASKVQEIEALMQALDEQEAEMEEVINKIGRLENELQQKNKEVESIESSRTKALKKLSVTVSKFDELHFLSESLLSEVERLQSELQERDGEVSFLRQEVTRCTNDVLSITQMNKKHFDEIHELLAWLDSLVSTPEVHDIARDKSEDRQSNDYKEELRKKILELVSELENVKAAAQNSDTLLHEERNKAEELERKEERLKNSLHEKESQLLMLQSAGNSVKAAISPSEIIEVEQMTNKWISPGAVAPQVRSLRKPNNDQVAISIDTDYGNDRLDDDDDDDKAHDFKSLTTSKFVPRFTRPVSDVIDGLWMSCDRALMRRPSLRLLVIFYWAVMHSLLAIYVV